MLRLFLILGLSVCLALAKPQPGSEEYDYEEEDVCLTSVDSEAPETECIFPFTFNNFTYHGCPTDPYDETKRWCSTKTDENGVHVSSNGTWGYCTPGCTPEIFPGNKYTQYFHTSTDLEKISLFFLLDLYILIQK